MCIEEKEVDFGNKSGYNARKIWNGFTTPENAPLYYEFYEHALNHLNSLMKKSGKPKIKRVDDPLGKGDYVLIKEDKSFSLGYHNGVHIEIVRNNIDIPKSELQIEIETKEREIQEKLDEQLKLSEDHYNSVKDVIVDEMENDETIKIELFNQFKIIYNIPPHISMEILFGESEDAKIVFETYCKEHESKNDDDYDYDDYDM